MTAKPVIELEKVCFTYNSSYVLEDVDLVVCEKDFLSIVGPNAGGKTTILKLILGLIKPTKGEVKVFGNSPVKARPRIGYMPQHTSLDFMFPVSVLDVVLMGRLGTGKRFGFYHQADKKAAEDALKRVELYDIRHRPFSDLSGGQSQRVLIARAIVSGPELLLLDEPTSNVDLAVETQLYDLLDQLNDNMTIVLVTHDLGFVSSYVKNVACVNRRVVSHPTCSITGEMINEIYGRDVHLIRHDHISHKGDSDV
ncbi:MAG TPA: metal ABC transporter ATP-binding protein [Deltaproteobacteria bacterium]|nr:metal ABC transporter ATP-binding protein [Deltaproteobacteria bacterium]